MAITGSTDLGNGILAVTVDHDPEVTATDVPAGSLIITSAGIWHRKIDDGSTTNVTGTAALKNSFLETTDPGVNDDNTQSYSIGSRWINTSTDKHFVCLDASTGAAVWKETTPGGIGIHGGTHVETGTDPVPNATTGVGGLLSAVDKTKLDGIEAGASALPVVDTTSIVKGSVDATKQARLEVDGLTTATTRVVTIPDKDFEPDDKGDARTPTTHAASHAENAADEIKAEDLGSAATDTGQRLAPDGTGGVEFVSGLGFTKNTTSTTDSTFTTVATIPIVDETTVFIETRVTARRTNGADRAGYLRRAMVFRTGGGGATKQGSTSTPFTRESEEDYNVRISVSGNNAIIEVRGRSAHNVNWTSNHFTLVES